MRIFKIDWIILKNGWFGIKNYNLSLLVLFYYLNNSDLLYVILREMETIFYLK